jgi:hypothetical protein
MTAKLTAISNNVGSLGTNKGEAFRFGDDNSGQLTGFRNKIINGDMRVRQRGDSSSGLNFGAGRYAHDRWIIQTSDSNLASWNLGAAASFGKYSLVFTGVAGSGAVYFSQRIESENTWLLAGKPVTVSLGVFGPAGQTVQIKLWTANAVDNFATITEVAAGPVVTLTGGWQTLVFTMPASLPDSAKNGIQLTIGFPGPVGATQVGITAVQLEEGSIATPFERRPIGLERSLCRRYAKPVVRSIFQATAPTQSIGYYDVSDMRATPTLSATSGWSCIAVAGVTAGATVTLPTVVNGDIQVLTVTSGLVAGNASATVPPAGALWLAEL